MSEPDELGRTRGRPVPSLRSAVRGRSLAELAADLEQDVAELDKPLRRLTEMGLLRLDADDRDHRGQPDARRGNRARRRGSRSRRAPGRRSSRAATRSVGSSPTGTTRCRGRQVDAVGRGDRRPDADRQRADALRRPLPAGAAVGRAGTAAEDADRQPHPGREPLLGASRHQACRLIYQHVALRDRHTRSYLTELADNGARIRFASSVPGRSLVIDREVALLPMPTDDANQAGLAVVREPNVIAWVDRDLRTALGRGADTRGRADAGTTTTPISIRRGRRSCG